jgi:hypothetical protein
VIAGFWAAATVAQGVSTFGGPTAHEHRLASDIGNIFGT